MTDDAPPPLPQPVATALHNALAQPSQRIRALALPGGGRVWLKRIEQASGLMRLQKGNGQSAFVAERDALRLLHARGVPVAQVMAEGPDYLLLPDLGPTLAALMQTADHPKADRIAAFAAAGAALAGLHRAGFSHGRPALRDFCWQQGALRLIDLERFRNRKRSRLVRAMDVVIFTHSWFAQGHDTAPGPELDGALNAYRAAAPAGLWRAVARLVRLLAPLGTLARGVARISKPSKDVQAIPPALTHLAQVTQTPG
ncbi:MAG: lipopolysaccharide kinase InaA family protein [Pseudotabrizicola sp.]|uniref:lipopolysaccharide kinase InaA family protein n=1 Tax=Pseudotabrizicola sp. TaxID=2939647 RepID=UPI002718D81D|nr:lipopolysaccharide kinase InaA family protein [Pseudotabrizicola sp.]MDO9639454.1 lipopolysaccharide kinase InaA family protein [Pseudotabrizicola sp.]